MNNLLKNHNWNGKSFGFDLLMINDHDRNRFYQQSLHDVRDKVVLDIGAGTGLLSVLAAHAGAKKVYSFEYDPINYTITKNFIEKSGLSDTITLICADILSVDKHSWSHDPIDVIITETFANDCFIENFAFLVDHVEKGFNLNHNHRWIPDGIDLEIRLVNIERSAEFDPGVPLFKDYQDQINQAIDIYRDNLYHRHNQINLSVAQIPETKVENPQVIDSFKVDQHLHRKLDLANYQIDVPFSAMTNPYLQIDWKLHSQDRFLYINRCQSWRNIAFHIDPTKSSMFYVRFHPLTHALLATQK